MVRYKIITMIKMITMKCLVYANYSKNTVQHQITVYGTFNTIIGNIVCRL